MRASLIVAVLAVGGPITAGRMLTAQPSQTATMPVDLATLGPQIGATIPDFSLPDQYGQTRSLESLMGPEGVVLVFFRSADW